MNTFGMHFRLTTFGESHGKYVGGVIDGCPAGFRVNKKEIRQLLHQRMGTHASSTERRERDKPKFISGLNKGVTTGAPIAFLLKNRNMRSKDYDQLRDLYRPSHADYTYHMRYGGFEDRRGGGRSSARETAARVVAGGIAMQILKQHGIEILSYTSKVGSLVMEPDYLDEVKRSDITNSEVGCPMAGLDAEMSQYLKDLLAEGDSTGGVVTTIVRGVPAGWGSPLYARLDAKLAEAMMGINAAKGFEVGAGFAVTEIKGSGANDPIVYDNGDVKTLTNHSGGIQGGVSNGAVIRFRTAFKPIASISWPQQTITYEGEPTTLSIEGRHDTSVFPRVLPVVDAMTALVLVDELLRTATYFESSILKG